MEIKKLNKIKEFKILLLLALIIIGSITLTLTMFRSGLSYDYGIGFWGANTHDGIWHISVSEQILKSFPPDHPIYSGFKLTNYHYFFNYFLALLEIVSPFRSHNLYFQFIPIIFSISIGVLSFLVGNKWKGYWTGFWLAFFNYFGSSLGWLVTFFREGVLSGESTFWSMQSISTLINPPYALSLIIILIGLYFLLVKKTNYLLLIFTGIIFGSLIIVKAYSGVIVLFALAGLAFYSIFKKNFQNLIIFISALTVSVILFLLTNKGSASLFEYQPFWFMHSMIESPDRFYLPDLAIYRQNLQYQGTGIRLIVIELIIIFIFLIGNLSTRVIGFLTIFKNIFKKIAGELDIFLYFGLLAGLIPVIFFVQKGTAWNTIQFFYYFMFFLNFYAAKTLADLTGKKKKNIFILAIIVVLTIPGISSLRHYIFQPAAAIYPQEVKALEFLKKADDGIVLTYAFDPQNRKNKNELPIQLYNYDSTAYVSAFSGKQAFFEDERNLEITSVPLSPDIRKKQILEFFTTENETTAREFLLKNNIKYIYLVDKQKMMIDPVDLGVEMIFNNEKVRIYQVKR
jgi:hypothetical protein